MTDKEKQTQKADSIEAMALTSYKLMNFTLGNLHCVLRKIPDMSVFHDSYANGFGNGFIVINTDTKEEMDF